MMMACESRAGLEAQKLISISLGKMAASRVGRTGASLHKSLLVASVLHRARHVFLEESYHLHRAQHPEQYVVHPQPVYAPMPPTPPPQMHLEAAEAEDKENVACEPEESSQQSNHQAAVPTAAEPARTPLQDSNTPNTRVAALKRRRCVSEQETQDAVSSILPKKAKTSAVPSTPTTPTQQTELPEGITDVSDDEDGDCANSMEVEHITSLVSIFSFGGQRTSELCATQAAREDNQTFQPVVALAV